MPFFVVVFRIMGAIRVMSDVTNFGADYPTITEMRFRTGVKTLVQNHLLANLDVIDGPPVRDVLFIDLGELLRPRYRA